MTIINLTTPMLDDKDRKRYIKAAIDAIEQYTEKHMNDEYGRIHTDGSRSGGQPVAKDPAAEWQAGHEAGVEAAAKAIEADAKLCDCAARAANECACGAWDDYKSITSARAVEIVRELKATK